MTDYTTSIFGHNLNLDVALELGEITEADMASLFDNAEPAELADPIGPDPADAQWWAEQNTDSDDEPPPDGGGDGGRKGKGRTKRTRTRRRANASNSIYVNEVRSVPVPARTRRPAYRSAAEWPAWTDADRFAPSSPAPTSRPRLKHLPRAQRKPSLGGPRGGVPCA